MPSRLMDHKSEISPLEQFPAESMDFGNSGFQPSIFPSLIGDYFRGKSHVCLDFAMTCPLEALPTRKVTKDEKEGLICR
jgi:hypothetical protein